MGKSTGFMEYERTENAAAEPLSRINNFSEFHTQADTAERLRQSARCMNCGVPFCQSGCDFGGGAVSGCPLHNLIPEWNDEVYKHNFSYAAKRLLKTNNFPEFTGRVCPALCEAACTCAMNGDAVTVKENELFIIENAYKNGYIVPEPPKTRSGKKIAVVGSGPAGLAVADRLNKRGHSVTVFERDDRPGGLLMYGIPNMKLDKSVISRRTDIMQAEGIEFRFNCDIGRNTAAAGLVDEYDAVVLCCGAKKPRDITAAGRDCKGVYFAVDYLTAVTKALVSGKNSSITAEKKKVVIIGGGDTGNDCVASCIRQGAESVTQLEIMPPPPLTRAENNPWPQWPRVLKTDYGQEEAIALFGHDPRLYSSTVKEFITDKNSRLKAVKTVKLNAFKEVPGSEEIISADMVLIAAGFTGTEDYIADTFGVQRSARNSLATVKDSYFTGVDKIFAAGDARRGQSLVVWAIAEGRACAKEVDNYLMGYTNMI